MFSFLWNDVLINPMINGLIIISRLLFNNFGVALIVFTVLVRVVTIPLTLRQLKSSRRMQLLQPKLEEFKKKYSDPKRRSEETMKLYKEEGVNPLGCLGPMVIQMPVLFALYQVLVHTVGGTPENIADLSTRLYSWNYIQNAIPLRSDFLWLDLGRSDRILPIFVFLSMWLQTKLSLNQTSMGGAQTQQTNQIMLWMMPVMFAFFSLNYPSGLALYWVVTNIIGIIMNWFVYGWRDRPWQEMFTSANAPAPSGPRRPIATGGALPAPALTNGARKQSPAPRAGADERQSDAQSGNKRKERRGGGEQGASAARTRPVSGRRRGR